MAQVIIENKAGERYEVSVKDFKQRKVRDGETYETSGFKIVSNVDGSPYEAPNPREPKAETAKTASKARSKTAAKAKTEPVVAPVSEIAPTEEPKANA